MGSFSPVYDVLSSLPLPKALKSMFSQWTPGVSPMSTNLEVYSSLVVYLAVIFGGQYLLKNRKAFKLKTAFLVHNVFLSTGSGLLLACMVEELVPIIAREGLFNAICLTTAWTPRLEQFYCVNYAFKYLEWIDTAFLVAKKKPLKFLHVFHHAATMLLCYVQLNGRTSVSWVPIVLNLFVHVLMYYYYAASSVGCKIWWKKYLTTMQITQFIIDLGVVYFASYNLFASRYAPQLPYCGECAGSEGAAVMGCGLLTSYLFLFIAFYRATYKKKTGPISLPIEVPEKSSASGTSSPARSDSDLMS